MKLSAKPRTFNSRLVFSIFCMLAAFITYCSMYAFRKPFTAGVFEGLELWGMDYKIILITTQVIGYMLSKFLGIKVVSEMTPTKRVKSIIVLIGIAWLSLLLFASVPYPFNFIFMFFNGLPLGMIWGIVFSFLEGRRNTELLGAGMSVSFIVASGAVKAVGRYLVDYLKVSEFWMPFFTGLVFIPTLLVGLWMLQQIPPPDEKDISLRVQRVPMDRAQRWAFFKEFSWGILFIVGIYVALTIFRDLRDNFAVEIWTIMGYTDTPQILVISEVPIAIGVFIIIALMMYIKKNSTAFYSNIGIIFLGGSLLLLTTYLFEQELISPTAWMILVGFGMYLSYVSYHTMLFERWIAFYKYKSNIGFLMYIADSFGYLGSVSVLFYKNFSSHEQNWLSFMTSTSYIVGGVTILLAFLSLDYFRKKARSLEMRRAIAI